MTIHIGLAGGIGDDSLNGMLSGITKLLDPDWYDVVALDYPHSYGPVPGPGGVSFDNGLAVLDKSIRDLLLESGDTSVGLIGYSAGAAGVGDTVAHLLDTWPSLTRRIAFVVLVADPRRPAGDGLPGHGVAGSRSINAPFPVIWVSDPRDPICCCTSDALYTLADQSAAFSLVDPIAWVRDLGDRLRTQRWQEVARLRPWELPAIVRRYRVAFEHLSRYPHEHVLYDTRVWPGTDLPYLAEAARSIQEVCS